VRIELGFGLITCQRYPGVPRSDRELYVEAIELAVEAERLGFDSVWVSEHHFVDDAYMPSLLPMCAAIAARTDRIGVGTGLLLAPLYEPIRLAEDATVVDLISGGRLTLGLGLGWREEEFEVLGVPLRERARRLEDCVAVLRQAWEGTPVTGGSLVSYPGTYVTPAPARRAGAPIWIGALTEPAVRRAGRIGDGFIATEASPEAFAEQVAWAREELVLVGRDPAAFRLSLYMPTFVFEGDAEEAWRTILPYHHYVWWKYDDMEGARSRGGPPQAPPPPAREAEAELRAGIVFGTPQDVADRIARYGEAAGGDVTYIARLYWPGMDPALQRETMRLFAEEVAPRLPVAQTGGRGSAQGRILS